MERAPDLTAQKEQFQPGQATKPNRHYLEYSLIAGYLLAIISANLIVAYFQNSPRFILTIVTTTNAFLFIGLDLTTRDALHERWYGRQLWCKMLLLIATGSILSWFLNRESARIALASFVAFSGAGVADTLAYWLLGDKTRLLKINGSNVVSAVVDSLLFPAIAFGLPLLWPIVLGQFVAKVGGGFVWSLVLSWRPLAKREARR